MMSYINDLTEELRNYAGKVYKSHRREYRRVLYDRRYISLGLGITWRIFCRIFSVLGIHFGVQSRIQ